MTDGLRYEKRGSEIIALPHRRISAQTVVESPSVKMLGFCEEKTDTVKDFQGI